MTPRHRRPAFLDLAALAVSLMGFVGLIVVVWALKIGTPGIPRILFLAFLAMACAPFYVALVRAPKLPFLIPPIVAAFLLYPIGSPHGVVYSTDPIFNYAFTQTIVDTRFWSPGVGNAFAHIYSFYPIGNVFIGYVILTAGVPPPVAYLWIQPVLRLLAVPAIVYAIGGRWFGPRVAALGLLFYLGTASILFNVPIQQGTGVLFVGLALLALAILTQHPDRVAKRRSAYLFALVALGIVMTHHLSSYIFAAWLGGLLFLMGHRRFRPAGSSLRLTTLAVYFIAVLGLYILLLTYEVFFGHEQIFEQVVSRFLSPQDLPTSPGGEGRTLGRTFTYVEIAWLAGSVVIPLLLALIAIRRYHRMQQHPFAISNGVVAAAVVIVTLPLGATALSYVPLRIGEYSNLFIAPLAATTLVRWTRSGSSLRWLWSVLWTRRETRVSIPPLVAMVVAAGLVMGGALAPLAHMRTYFDDPDGRTTDSPVFLGQDALRAAGWARAHVGEARVWGDQLAVDTFVGFADMRVEWGSAGIFEGETFDPTSQWQLDVGNYVVVNRLMLTHRPNFFQQPAFDQPLTTAEVAKFGENPHLALVYQDETFSVYRVMTRLWDF